MNSTTTTTISDAMMQGVDFTSGPCVGTPRCSSAIRCPCNAGYNGPDSGASKGQCTICPSGTWSGVANTSVCTSCGAGGVSPVGSTAFGACVFDCPAGSTGLPGACLLCVAGKYKTSTGSAACTDCGAGSYSVTVGATAAGACVVCPVNSYSVVVGASSVSTCTCNAGYTGPDGGACSACLPGSFKAQTGSAACALCPNNTFSDTGGNSSCVPCQTNTVSVSGIASQTYCYYKIGYTHTTDMSTCLRVDRQRDVSSVSGGSVVA